MGPTAIQSLENWWICECFSMFLLIPVFVFVSFFLPERWLCSHYWPCYYWSWDCNYWSWYCYWNWKSTFWARKFKWFLNLLVIVIIVIPVIIIRISHQISSQSCCRQCKIHKCKGIKISTLWLACFTFFFNPSVRIFGL